MEDQMMEQNDAADVLEAGRDALTRRSWREARELLSRDDLKVLLTPQDLEGLAEAALWTSEAAQCIELNERAYASYTARGDARGSARMAINLHRDYEHRGQNSVGAGWLKRAVRILESASDCPEHGYLARQQANVALGRGDLNAAGLLAKRILDVGTMFHNADLMALGLHEQGRVLLARGQVDEGMALLEEATAAAVAGELTPYTTGVIYCNMIQACRDTLDFGRAGEWTEAARRWCERQSVTGFPGVCRIHRAEIMQLRGALQDAEDEARGACEELQGFAQNVVCEGLYRIGEIRLRLGDLAAAEDAFARAHEMGREPQPGLSMLRLAQGRADQAASGLRRALDDDSWGRFGRARLLPAYIEAAIAANDVTGARSALPELEELTQSISTAAFVATMMHARGSVELAEGDDTAAARSLRRSVQLWQEVDAPYEAAKARVVLGLAYMRHGDREAAVGDWRAAKSAFDRLGAVLDSERAEAMLNQPAPALDSRVRATERTTKTFMFTDIVKSTNLVEAMGDGAWSDLLSWHDDVLRSLIASHSGDEIVHTGDGFFVAFDHPAAALRCAVAIQRRLAEHRREHGFAPQVRIGLHASEALGVGQNYRGKGVHEAQRIAALASGGEILASEYTLNNLDAQFAISDSRQVPLKGITAPVTIVTIGWTRIAGTGGNDDTD